MSPTFCIPLERMTRAGQMEAAISPDGLYRWWLLRQLFDVKTASAEPAVVTYIMCNPSTASSVKDDPTLRECMFHARRWGYMRLVVVNLWAWRTPYLEELHKARMAKRHVVGVLNDVAIRAAVEQSDLVVAAWGNHGKTDVDWPDYGREHAVVQLVHAAGKHLFCLGLTKSGSPKHPLARGRSRVPRDQEPELWKPHSKI